MVIDAFRGLNAHILVQEYIREAKGCDIRCLVVGGRVVAAIERQAKPGEFRSNLHRGGTARKVNITGQERATAIKACTTLGLDVAGVDILRSDRGPLVMEVNASPGLEGVETTTGMDIAGIIIEYIEQRGRLGFCLKSGGNSGEANIRDQPRTPEDIPLMFRVLIGLVLLVIVYRLNITV